MNKQPWSHEFSRTLNKASHICLINNLKLLGIKSLLVNRLNSYLSDRISRAIVKFTSSQATERPIGSPKVQHWDLHL